MNTIDTILADLSGVRHPLSSSLTLPPAVYHDAAWLQRELDQIFHQSWLCVGRSDRAQTAGDYFTCTVGSTSLLIVRDEHHALHGFANTCRHRGMPLARGEGRCRALVCPFHGWSYALDGSLHSAPRMETCDNFNAAEHGLVEFPLAESDGLAFFHLGPDPQPLEDWLVDFEDVHAPWDLAGLVTTRVREFEVACNWKTFIEVFNEYYHLPYVHPDSINAYYREPDPTDAVMGEYTTQFGAADGAAAVLEQRQDSTLPDIPGLTGRFASGTRYTWIYPATTFAASNDSLWMYQALPLTADRCHVIQTVAFPEASTQLPDFADKSLAYYERIDTAIDEDLPFLIDQQQGLSSPYARQGRFSALEPSVGNFACWYAERMA